jgi:hypothetical protein
MSQTKCLRAVVVLGLWSLSACAPHISPLAVEEQLAPCCQSRYPKANFATASTAQLGAEYRRLKRRQCPACARFGSDLQSLMRVLGQRLDGELRPTLTRVLGRPDRVRGDSLVYYWRGNHDYLYFRVGADQRGHSAWYYAYE